MSISRRHFLAATAATIVNSTLAAQNRARTQWFESSIQQSSDSMAPLQCLLMDLNERCGLDESLRGYETALTQESISFRRSTFDALPESMMTILPGCTRLDHHEMRGLCRLLQRGAVVLLESGTIFSDRATAHAHRIMLQSQFGLELGSPINLWRNIVAESRVRTPCARHRIFADHLRTPYVELNWPIGVAIRDFSRVLPIDMSLEKMKKMQIEVIGHVAGQAIATRQPFGNGHLVFLGSPLGPALHAGDKEAAAWLKTLTRSAVESRRCSVRRFGFRKRSDFS